MAIIGYNSKKLGSETIPNITCKHCGTQEGFRATLFARYAHLSFIPAFPLGRPAVMECVHCKRTIGGKDFTAEQAAAVASLKAKYKSPIWTWSFLIIVGLFTVGSTLYEALRTKSSEEKLLHADFELMATKKVQDQDSLSQMLSSLMKLSIAEGANPERFHYLSKQKEDKLLVLVEIPELSTSTEKDQKLVLDILSDVLDKLRPETAVYIGLQANDVVKATKTPTGITLGSSVRESELYPFYKEGAAPAAGENSATEAPAEEKATKKEKGKKR